MDLLEHAQLISSRSSQCQNEESAKQFLIIPTLDFLGYDVLNPSIVRPEHHADFAKKNRNRVDYAIFFGDEPRIGIEAKSTGTSLDDYRGQLRGYFNALPSIKMGILTDGVRYECYADTDEPNIMDDAPFLAFDFSLIAENGADENTTEGINGLRCENFDPENIGATARQKLMLSSFIRTLRNWSSSPSDDLVRTMLSETGYSSRITRKALDDAEPVVRDAFKVFINREILKRVGFEEAEVTAQSQEDVSEDEVSVTAIETTESEMAAYEYVRQRLAYLVDSEELYNAIDHVFFRDMKTTFKVFYRKQNAGSLFNFSTRSNGEMVFSFPALDDLEIQTYSHSDIDNALLESFKRRVLS